MDDGPCGAMGRVPMNIAQRLQRVRAQIRQAAAAAERSVQDIRLIAVSKHQSVAAICEAYDAGQRDFGENYAQELQAKAEKVAATGRVPRWHFIGHLQRNKVRRLLLTSPMVHTVDSWRLAQALDHAQMEQMALGAAPLPVLLQINVDQEAQKAGVDPNQALPLAQAVLTLKHVQLCGLMAIPATITPTMSRDGASAFRRLRRLRDALRAQCGARMGMGLSMGMSHDFANAIVEGATLVRVGTAIFGSRAHLPRSAP